MVDDPALAHHSIINASYHNGVVEKVPNKSGMGIKYDGGNMTFLTRSLSQTVYLRPKLEVTRFSGSEPYMDGFKVKEFIWNNSQQFTMEKIEKLIPEGMCPELWRIM